MLNSVSSRSQRDAEVRSPSWPRRSRPVERRKCAGRDGQRGIDGRREVSTTAVFRLDGAFVALNSAWARYRAAALANVPIRLSPAARMPRRGQLIEGGVARACRQRAASAWASFSRGRYMTVPRRRLDVRRRPA